MFVYCLFVAIFEQESNIACTRFEKIEANFIFSRSFVAIFEQESNIACARFEKIEASFIFSRSFVAIFAKTNKSFLWD